MLRHWVHVLYKSTWLDIKQKVVLPSSCFLAADTMEIHCLKSNFESVENHPTSNTTMRISDACRPYSDFEAINQFTSLFRYTIFLMYSNMLIQLLHLCYFMFFVRTDFSVFLIDFTIFSLI